MNPIGESDNILLETMLDGVKAVLFTNVASKWGLTKRSYEELVQFYNAKSEKGLEIILFPCNQFKNQEPGTDEEIVEF